MCSRADQARHHLRIVHAWGRRNSRRSGRAADLVKSGGEWISSVALANALIAHPAVAQAAVVALRHPKWDDRREFLVPSFAKWWLPDRIEFAAEIPRTSVGKFRKSVLREPYKGLHAVD